MLKRVPAIKTKFNKSDYIKAVTIAWKNKFGTLPKKEQIGVLYSQWGVETGEGQFCWNYNLGNIKAVDDPNKTIEYCALTGVWEIIKGKSIVLDSEDPGAWFRSFQNIEDGAFFYLEKLHKKFNSAWTAVESGNPAAFAHLLKVALYYTAPEADYVKLMNFYFNKYMKDDTFEKTVKELTPPAVVVPVEPPKDSFFDKFKKILG
jgi:hypothetical protein